MLTLIRLEKGTSGVCVYVCMYVCAQTDLRSRHHVQAASVTSYAQTRKHKRHTHTHKHTHTHTHTHTNTHTYMSNLVHATRKGRNQIQARLCHIIHTQTQITHTHTHTAQLTWYTPPARDVIKFKLASVTSYKVPNCGTTKSLDDARTVV